MKIKNLKITFLMLASCTWSASYSQIFIEANLGLNRAPSSGGTNFSHSGFGIGYMYDDLVGVKIDYAKDNFNLPTSYSKSKRVDVQIVANFSNLFFDKSYYDSFYVLGHAGMGISSLHPSSEPVSDKNVNIIMGISPKYRIIDGLDFISDASLIMNLNQNYNFDGTPTYQNLAVPQTGLLLNVSLGLMYTFRDYR